MEEISVQENIDFNLGKKFEDSKGVVGDLRGKLNINL